MQLTSFFNACKLWLGIEKNQTSHGEKVISALGAMTGIISTILITQWLLQTTSVSQQAHILIVASLGATAVLVFAVPHGALSQPWQVIAGHLLSAFVGVTCQYYLGSDFISAGLAVGLSVGLMYYLRCIHPPGGATALTAVIGGNEITQLGYHYLFAPILVNILAILLIAVSFNALFRWRRYPAHFATKNVSPTSAADITDDLLLTTEDFNAAIRELDSFVDLTEEGLSELLEKARQNAMLHIEHPAQIQAGKYYSNGKIGHSWAIRHVIDAGQQRKNNDVIIYKTVAGADLYTTGMQERESFRQWARFEVEEHHGMWLKAE